MRIFINHIENRAKILFAKGLFLTSILLICQNTQATEKTENNLFPNNFPYSNDCVIDTSREEYVSWNKAKAKDSGDADIVDLLSTHPVFNNHWVTDETFVFEDIELEDISYSTPIQLVSDNEGFKLTWYGKINSPFKQRWGKFHQGIDIDLRTGDSVFSAFDGIVRYAQFNNSGYGNCVVVRHLNGLETVYGHLSKLLVSPNQFVKAGNTIGLGGSTGRSTGPHLHFEIRYKDFSFDPLLIIDPQTQILRFDSFELKRDQLYPYKYGRAHKRRISSPWKDKALSADSVSITRIDENIKKEESYTKDSIQIEETKPVYSEPEPAVVVRKPTTAPKKKVVDSEKKKTVVADKKKNKTEKKKDLQKTKSKKEAKPKKEVKTKKGKKTASGTHIVKKGESLSVISEKTGVPIKTLRSKNKIKSDKKLMPGDKIKY
jgi:murein DD-endopeptidase MepM/ murein hydrolase activator NlpD/LysM repeat protein